jgi:hypothetical protein
VRAFGAVPLVLAGFTVLAPESIEAQSDGRTRSIGPYTPPPTAAAKVDANPPPRIAEFGTIASPVVLRAAAVDARDQLRAMEAWNRSGGEPQRAGFTRSLPDAIAARFGVASGESAANPEPHAARARSSGGLTFWGTKITVGDAHGIRLHLTGVALPPGTRFWSYGTDGKPIGFGLEVRAPGGDLWTPITFGEIAYLDVEIPSGAEGRFSILEIAEIRPRAAPMEPPCAIDAACVAPATFPAIAEARKAVALLHFMVGNEAAWCTGTLLNDTAQDGIPYMLTAHHCISDQPTVSSLHALWDYDAPSCGGAVPDLSALESSVGGTLLGTGVASDFCLMQLSSLPSGRSFMGWDARTSSLAPGTTLYRLSHPTSYLDVEHSPLPMEFSESLVDAASSACLGGEDPDFVFARLSMGFDYFGSSGAALLRSGGQVVGQLKGPCEAIIQVCEAPPDLYDGAFSTSYPFIARWLDAPSPTCVADPATLCLSTRFQATAQWTKPDGTSGSGTAVSLTPDSGYFWFFDPSNVEIVAKVVNGCGVNAHYWAFASGLTNTGVALTFTDLATGSQKTYRSAAGTVFEPIQDTSAFATCP